MPAAARQGQRRSPRDLAVRAGLGVAAVAGLAVLVASCASPAPRCPITPRDPHAAPLLWRVQRGSGPPAWLYGTVHDSGAEDVPPAAWTVLDAAPVFVSELGDAEPDRSKLAELARLPWGQVLDRLLPADDWWELVNALLGVMREDDLRHARPWFAMVTLRGHMAQSPRPSMDVALAEHARKRGIAVDRLESWDDQLVALDASVTVADLSAAIRTRNAVACEVARLRSAYRTGDIPALIGMLIAPVRNDALLVDRNRRWLPQIERYLAGRGAFIAVGVGHLLGDDGLLAALERAGYTVKRHAAGSPIVRSPWRSRVVVRWERQTSCGTDRVREARRARRVRHRARLLRARKRRYPSAR